MSILKKLTEGIINRDLSKEGAALLAKWERTGLLEGLEGDVARNNMAVLLENQAKELLRETTTMSGGDVEGFAAVAFPLVRRVFAGLIANQLVSVQPMSLPSGLIFFLDFTKSAPPTGVGGYVTGDERDGLAVGGAGGGKPSIYGGNKIGSQVTGGVDLSLPDPGGFTGLRQGHSAARGVVELGGEITTVSTMISLTSSGLTALERKALQHDPDLVNDTSGYAVIMRVEDSTLQTANVRGSSHPLNSSAVSGSWKRAQLEGLTGLDIQESDGTVITGLSNLPAGVNVVRRLTRMVTGDGVTTFIANKNTDGTKYLEVVLYSANTFSGSIAEDVAGTNFNDPGQIFGGNCAIEFPIADNLTTTDNGGGALVGATAWEMENSKAIPEINIKVDSIPVTSTTRKLKAHWTPELAQDLNAYHNLDAEVELTGILSEEIALEIDQEIQTDLIRGAKAATYYWSRLPGKFVKKTNGTEIKDSDSAFTGPPDFTGTVSEWYETLIETVNDVSSEIHRKTLRGGANFLVTSPEVANVLEFTSGFRAKVTHDDDKGNAGAVNVGSMNNKFEVYVNPYFPRNLILVGRKGSSFLESGYVYAPYVPLQTTPTIFDPDNFTPRKAVMTRYGKKMVRPDMYGLVIVMDLLGG